MQNGRRVGGGVQWRGNGRLISQRWTCRLGQSREVRHKSLGPLGRENKEVMKKREEVYVYSEILNRHQNSGKRVKI